MTGRRARSTLFVTMVVLVATAGTAAAAPRCIVRRSGGTVTVTGGAEADTATITDAGTQITVSCDQINNRAFSAVNTIVVSLGDGNDRLTYSAADLALNGLSRKIVARLGRAGAAGNTASFAFGTIDAAAQVALNVAGGPANDKVTTAVGRVSGGSHLNVAQALGAGADPSSMTYEGQIDGAGTEVVTTIDLGSGNNRYTTRFSPTGAFWINNNAGQRVHHTVSGSNGSGERDVVRAFVGGRIDSRFAYQANLRDGNDISVVGIDYNSGVGVTAFGGRARYDVFGGAGNDTLRVNHTLSNGTPSTGGNGAFVHGVGGLLSVDQVGGPGNDRTTVDFGGGGFEVDSGALLRVRADGDNGVDDSTVPGRDTAAVVVHAAPNSNSAPPGNVEILVGGDNGADGPLGLVFTNNATTPFQSVTTEIDGGPGRDDCNGTVTLFRCEL